MNGIHEVRGSIPLGSTNQGSKDIPESTKRRWLWQDWVVALLLFLATAAIVVWQNSRLGVLWDLSYVLENAFRISLGDIPYRDFPFPYPPLTFLIQAAIIKLTGRVFWHHIAYCVAIGGMASILTWRILLNLLLADLARARLFAFILSLPVVVLGVYCIFPHPFYDPDCTFAILFGVLMLLWMERKRVSWWRGVLAGSAIVIPLLIKQNAGLVFLGTTVLGLLILTIIEWRRREAVRGYVFALIGATLVLAIACLSIHFTAGLRNYWHWTFQYAASRRTPARSEMLGIYEDKVLLLWLALLFIGLIGCWLSRRRNRVLAIASALLIAAPFLWPTIYLWRDTDPSERAERLIGVWPVLLIFAFLMALIAIKRKRGVSMVLPFILIATIHGVLMSQQLWGSTYAIWPLFMILLASALSTFSSLWPREQLNGLNQRWFLLPLTTPIALSLLISGGFYVWSHERLDYANLDDGARTRSKLPQLKGLSVRGDWLPNFEALLDYVNREIPIDQGILVLPGEDLFYYTTGRRPQFPVLLFDRTVNPYSPDEVVKVARERNIRWLIVKQDLQDEDEGLEKQRDELTGALEQEFEQIESMQSYDIYRRIEPGKPDEDDDKHDDDN